MGSAMRGLDLADPTLAFSRVPPQLVCATLIDAPRGLHDALWHIWSKDGVVVDRIALTIRGGVAAGFRTWSAKQNLGDSPQGIWGCEVVTESGQSLGGAQVLVSDDQIR